MVCCAAISCSTQPKHGIPMFKFPKDLQRRKIWVQLLKRNKYTPNNYSRLCAKHFAPDQFVLDPRIAASVGYKPKRTDLVPDAVPSKELMSYGTEIAKKKSRDSTAIEKRRRFQVAVVNQKQISHQNSRLLNESSLESTNVEAETDTQASSTKVSSFCQTSYNLVQRCSVSTQTQITMINVHTQTTCKSGENVSKDGVEVESDEDMETMSIGSDASEMDCRDLDPEWEPYEVSDEDCETSDQIKFSEDTKFIVYYSCLVQLLVCQICKKSLKCETSTVGTFLHIDGVCERCGLSIQWGSQPRNGTLPDGNLMLSAAILFSGSSPVKALNMLNHAKIQCFTGRTFYNIQELYLVPSINIAWENHLDVLLDEIVAKGGKVNVGGDGRCCSPGHTAKYGAYSLMNLETSKIIALQLVQSNEVKNSYGMELEGLMRCLSDLENDGIIVSSIVTDRHPQIKKYLREQHKDITHWFDVWHVAKGVKKKLEAAGKKKGSELCGLWAKSVCNHLYWCASSSGGNGELVREKWLSILNHVTNVHEGHGDLYPKCQHGPIEREWMTKDRKPYAELQKVVAGKLLVKDISKLSPLHQTSLLESYHKVLCFFAPKAFHYFHPQMEARLKLAAIHFNENVGREISETASGKQVLTVSFPKSRSGEAIAKEVKVPQTFGYVSELMDIVKGRRESISSYSKAKAVKMKEDMLRETPRPAPICSKYPKVDPHEIKKEIYFQI